MTIKEKIQHTDASTVNFHKEGIFWMAYEQSAYAVCKLKEYKANKKFVKAVNAEVVSVGFPDKALGGILSYFEIQQKTDSQISLRTRGELSLQTVQQWKAELPLVEKAHPTVPAGTVSNSPVGSLKQCVCQQLHSFDLANATPMRCMVFLSELKTLHTQPESG
jgi:hypothetical protein